MECSGNVNPYVTMTVSNTSSNALSSGTMNVGRIGIDAGASTWVVGQTYNPSVTNTATQGGAGAANIGTLTNADLTISSSTSSFKFSNTANLPVVSASGATNPITSTTWYNLDLTGAITLTKNGTVNNNLTLNNNIDLSSYTLTVTGILTNNSVVSSINATNLVLNGTFGNSGTFQLMIQAL